MQEKYDQIFLIISYKNCKIFLIDQKKQVTTPKNQSTPHQKPQRNSNSSTTNFSSPSYKESSNKENIFPKKQCNIPITKTFYEEKTFEEFKEIASEETEIIEEHNDLLCSEQIQDIRFRGHFEALQKEKEKKLMPNIMEETDEDMSNNCSPNKNNVINAIINKQKNKSSLIFLNFCNFF